MKIRKIVTVVEETQREMDREIKSSYAQGGGDRRDRKPLRRPLRGRFDRAYGHQGKNWGNCSARNAWMLFASDPGRPKVTQRVAS